MSLVIQNDLDYIINRSLNFVFSFGGLMPPFLFCFSFFKKPLDNVLRHV